jgi:hypothetical protein
VDSNLIYFVALILVPIIPAFVLFKFLPSTAVASGPFQGLKINVGGGFGGYFLILLISYPFIVSLTNSVSAQKWTIVGTISSHGPQEVDEITVHPPVSNPDSGSGTFHLELYIPNVADEVFKYPSIVVRRTNLETNSYSEVSVSLDPTLSSDGYKETDYKITRTGQTINIGTPIDFQPQAFAVTTPPAPVPSPTPPSPVH